MFLFDLLKARKRARRQSYDFRRGVYYYETTDGVIIRADPIQTYAKLKEIGFDVLTEEINGALAGNEKKIRSFTDGVCAAFGVVPYNATLNAGVTTLDCVRLYLGFYSFLATLKKNVIFLRDFAPRLEERLANIYASPGAVSELKTPDSSSSESTSTSPEPPQPPDSPSSTEQAAPSTDSI